MKSFCFVTRCSALLLALVMCLSMTPFTVFAAEDQVLFNTCEHHAVHTDECGYAAPVDASECTHVHDENCGYIEAREEVPCDCEADENGDVEHVTDCGYSPAMAGAGCNHVHDENCGYAEAQDGADCGFVCDICTASGDEITDEDDEDEPVEIDDGAIRFEVGSEKELQDAIAAVNDADEGRFVISMTADIMATDSKQRLSVKKNEVTLLGNGHTLSYRDYGGTKSVSVSGGVLNIGKDSLTITGKTSDAGVCVFASGTLNIYDGVVITDISTPGSYGAGAGVCVQNGTVNMYGGLITGCNAVGYGMGSQYGGGLGITDGTFNMYGGKISGCTATQLGGGVYVGYNATFNMSGGEISGNSGKWGGGVCNYGVAVINGDARISGNTATSYGGGLCMYNGSLDITGGTVSGNEAAYYGGGVYVGGGELNASGGSIVRNTAGYYGGGIGVAKDKNISVSGGAAVCNNTGVYAADDIFAQPGATVSLVPVISGLTLDSTGNNITGWFYDGAGCCYEECPDDRWSLDEDESFHVHEVTVGNGTTFTASDAYFGIKAAHELPPPEFAVTYTWTGLPAGATIMWPDETSYVENAEIAIDREFDIGTEAVVNGTVYVFSGWVPVNDIEISDNMFTMPAEAVTLQGVWAEKTYSVTYEWGGLPDGIDSPTVPVDGSNYVKNADVSVDDEYVTGTRVTVNKVTYEFSGWSLPDGIVLTDGTFAMPDRDVIIKGRWTVPTVPLDGFKALYLVKYLDGNGEELKAPEVRGPESVGNEVTAGDADKDDITMPDGSIYSFDADNSKNVLTGVLNRNTPVVLELYFTKTAVPATPIVEFKARYLVKWLDEDGNELKSTEMRGPEAVGDEVTVDEVDKVDITLADGSVYTFDAHNSKNVLSGVLVKDVPVVLELYFTKTAVPAMPTTSGGGGSRPVPPTPVTPVKEPVIEEPDPPKTETPEEIEIEPTSVPTSGTPEKTPEKPVDIPEKLPQTGDASGMLAMLLMCFGFAATLVGLVGLKRKNY